MSSRQWLRFKLREAVEELNSRGLKIAAKFACEQLLGMDSGPDADEGEMEMENESFLPSPSMEHSPCREADKDLVLFARSLLSLGEYQRCAHNIRTKKGRDLFTSKVAPSKSLLELQFMASYSLYMAGESHKDQLESESSSEKSLSKDKSQLINPFLIEILKELMPLYYVDKSRSGDPNNKTDEGAIMDGYLLYILGVVVRDLGRQGYGCRPILLPGQDGTEHAAELPSAITILTESARRRPFNWSCWLDLADLCLKEELPPPSHLGEAQAPPTPKSMQNVEYTAADSLTATQPAELCMHQFFLVHFYLEQQHGRDALEILVPLSSLFPNSQYVAVQIALARYSMRDYELAQIAFEGVREGDPHRLEHLDTYSNILYVKEKKAELSHLAHVVSKIDKFAPETCCIIGNYYSLKGQHEKSVLYFQRALRQNKSFLSAWTLMGHECVELRNTSAAVQCYRKAVDVSLYDYRAWYGLGQTYEMLHLYQYALYYYKKATTLRPTDVRMWCAVGNCYVRLGMKAEAISSFERAAEGDVEESLASRELARLHRDEGHFAQAAFYFFKHLFHTINTPDLEELQKICAKFDSEPMHMRQSSMVPDLSIDAEILNSIELDFEVAEALLYLAQFCKDYGNYSTATDYCNRLLDFGGQESANAKSLLREMRILNPKGLDDGLA